MYYDDVDTALKAVKKNDVWGLLYFPTNYTLSLAKRFVNGSRISDFDVELSTVQTWIDLSGKWLPGSIVKKVQPKIKFKILFQTENLLILCYENFFNWC